MGGLWEAGVKIFKTHFRKIAANYKYTFEELSTLLSKIESCLNSRPISPISTNPSDLCALTPGHFLIGSPILAPVDPQATETSISMTNRWQRLKLIHQNFCTRWKNEYLKEMSKRNKWQRPEINIEEGALVVIKDENLPPNAWRLGRVTKIFSGSDNRVRVAEILTQRGIITRPIVKLILLPNESSQQQNIKIILSISASSCPKLHQHRGNPNSTPKSHLEFFPQSIMRFLVASVSAHIRFVTVGSSWP